MKGKKLWWAFLAGVLLTEGYIIYDMSNMMYVAPTQQVVEINNDDDHVDESVDEEMYRTIWREENSKYEQSTD